MDQVTVSPLSQPEVMYLNKFNRKVNHSSRKICYLFNTSQMKAFGFLIILVVFIIPSLPAQKNEPVTVKAGTRVQDYFAFQEMYRYPEFTAGSVVFKNGTKIRVKLNYNLLYAEMQYIQAKDTLSIANEEEISFIVAAGDTFFVDKGYLELIYSNRVRVALKQYFKLMETQKKDSYGSAGSNSATDSYGAFNADGKTYKLISNQDRIYKKIAEYYLATSLGEFVPFTRKKAMQLFPQHKRAIENYLKSEKVDFNSGEDLLRLAVYLNDLQ